MNVALSNNIPFYHMNSNLRKSFYNFRLSKFVQKIMLTSFPTIEIAWKNGAGLLTVSGVFSSKYSSLYRIWHISGMKYQQGPLVFPLKETLTSFEFRYWIKCLHFFLKITLGNSRNYSISPNFINLWNLMTCFLSTCYQRAVSFMVWK